MSTMASQFRVELVGEEAIPDLAKLIVPTFCEYSVEKIMGNTDTPEGIEGATQRHLYAAREHMEDTGRRCAVKCVDVATDEMAACAYWYVYDRPRSVEKLQRGAYLASAEWLPEGEQRQRAVDAMKAVIETQAKWARGRPYALLMYMATDPAWRRKGAATACVKWGLELCKELGIMAYLEASEQGAPVYKALGFEVVEHVTCEVDGEVSVFPAMIWWPTGTKDEDKRPLDARSILSNLC